ncbi:PucR family transcriptional regulator [Actinomadura logoneensis]|uniref:PucR family transcriptional regulator n=1 Tax=Actinomadura logoneensis TaxID=2293572 RepID=A0A372JB30_9ACTN|nr:helix-turn-helix domain-containing protein [Actinomadura logoneensis]RFU37024.1 PucR family transcriptional regulator [Actinomadura logoneensis]
MEEPDPRLRLLLAAADPGLLDGTVRAARARSTQVGELPEAEVRRHVRALVEGVVASLATGGEPDPAVLEAAGRLGSDRARQGVPVAALLDGFQAGREYLLRRLIGEGRRRGVSDGVLLDGLTTIDGMTTALVHRMVHAHRTAELEMAQTTRESHAQLLRRLLHGEPTPRPAPLEPATAYHFVVSDVSDPAVASRLEGPLTEAGRGLAALVDGRMVALVARLPDLPADAPLMVAAPPRRPAEVAPLYSLARRALAAGAHAGLRGLRHLGDLALLTAADGEPELGRLLAGSLLGALDPDDPFHRELAETALAYLDHGSRIDPAAAALHVHGNTVKYRLRRLRDLTGGPPATASVADTAHWWWALRTWLSISSR